MTIPEDFPPAEEHSFSLNEEDSAYLAEFAVHAGLSTRKACILLMRNIRIAAEEGISISECVEKYGILPLRRSLLEILKERGDSTIL